MSTATYTRTYTITDIRRVFASLAADFAMIANATGLWSRDFVTEIFSDLVGFAGAGCLMEVDIILWSASGREMRAAKFSISTSATGWANQRPGNNLWPRTPGGRLQVIATLSSDWWALTEARRQQVRDKWGIMGEWGRVHTDTSHPGLSAAADRRYASNGYGLAKTSYE